MTDRHLLTIVVEVHADPVTDDPQEVAERILDDATGLDGEPHRPDMIAATWDPPTLPLPGTIACVPPPCDAPEVELGAVPADVPTTTTEWAAGPPLTVNRPED